MRPLLVPLILTLSLCIPSLSQQSSSAQTPEPAKGKKSKSEPAQPAPEAKPQESSAPVAKPEAPKEAPASKSDDKEEHYDMTEIPPIVTHRQITVDGKLLKYTATVGRLPIKRGDGRIDAEMFFVAYTLDGQDAGKRPVTFCFNGGPGSATVWLHMGAAPYRITDNQNTLLDRSDLVFVDAVATGFSRAANAEMTKKFLGLQGDIEAFGEFIRL